ncbi:hypothetical protein [Aquimarina longa]|uniref:hypothetical protein n=1 Tax=Aquimarina longa TaxID=1080221 RepID=UPI0007835E5F|nr:hypothetical protein [Aquimarina longa]
MYLQTSVPNEPYLMVKPNSDLDNIKPEYLENKYVVRLSGSNYEKSFIEKFIIQFKDVKNLDIGNKSGGDRDNSFIYEFQNLEGLVISLYRDTDFILDCSRLPKSLYSLNLSVWSKKHIINIEALNDTDLEVLYVADFDEKDLTKLSGLTNLKGLSVTRSKIKSLKGIEMLTNLERISFGGVRSLTDISDITALQNLKHLEFDICWKLKDFSPIGELKKLKELELLDCKNLESIKFVKNLPNLKRLSTLGTTIINDYDTTPAEHVPVFFGSQNNKYNKQYPEKEIHKKIEEL